MTLAMIRYHLLTSVAHRALMFDYFDPAKVKHISAQDTIRHIAGRSA